MNIRHMAKEMAVQSLVAITVVTSLAGIVLAAPPGSPFNLGETLNPGCAPGDVNCTVVPPAASGANADITSLTAVTSLGIDAPTPEGKLNVRTTAADPNLLSYFGPLRSLFTALSQGYIDYGSSNFTSLNSASTGRGAALVGVHEDNSTNDLNGIYGYVESRHGAGIRANAEAVSADAYHSGTGTVTALSGLSAWAGADDGVIDRLSSLFARTNDNSGATITNNHGLYLADQSGIGTNNWQIYSDTSDPYVLDSNGNVGIGTTSPAEKLDIRDDGDADLDITTYSNGGGDFSSLHIYGANGTEAAPGATTDSQEVGAIDFFGHNGVGFSEMASIQVVADEDITGTESPGRILFRTTNDSETSAGTRMELDKDGQLLLGPTTFTDEEFHIGPDADGSSDTAISMENNGHVYEIHVEDTDEFVIYENEDENSGNSVLMYNGTTDHWGFGTDPDGDAFSVFNGASLSAGGVWTDASSRELKKNIASLSTEEALEALRALDPVSFEYLNEEGEQYLGFIAEEVPELVAMDGRESLSAMDIVAVLTKVLQQQEQRIEELEKRLAE